MKQQRVNLAVPTFLGGGMLTGNSMEEALGGFLSRFSGDDIRTFMEGYMEHTKRKAQRTQKVSMVRPTTAMATVTTQKPTAPVKAAAKPVERPVSATRATYAPPAPRTKDSLWQEIVKLAGGDDNKKIAAFLATDEGDRLYIEYEDALAGDNATYAAYPQAPVKRFASVERIEQLARQQQRAGETFQQAYSRLLSEDPELYEKYRCEIQGMPYRAQD